MMCDVCGCGQGELQIEDAATHSKHRHHHGHEHPHRQADEDYAHRHSHGVARNDAETGPETLHFGHGPAGAHAPGLTQTRMVQIQQDVLAKNDAYARENRGLFVERGILALNLVSSPGSGKTTLLTATIEHLKDRSPLAVIEGDQQTVNDAERIRATGVPALQVNTGKGCHLDAHMVGHALETLAPPDDAVLFIENVGNLVCPAGFDLGEAHKVVILSVTEGEDKPIKYPDMFAAADLLLLNKIDLLPYLDFDVATCLDYARRVNPRIEVQQVSARSGEGLETWIDWVLGARRRISNERPKHR